MKKSIEKRIFELVDSLGERLTGTVHILNGDRDDHDITYRVYHQDGYCWDICKREAVPESMDDINNEDGYVYTVFDEWEGFSKLSDRMGIYYKIDIGSK